MEGGPGPACLSRLLSELKKEPWSPDGVALGGPPPGELSICPGAALSSAMSLQRPRPARIILAFTEDTQTTAEAVTGGGHVTVMTENPAT